MLNPNQSFKPDYEIWKDIPGYKGKYQVSHIGRVRSLDHFVKCGPSGRGNRLVMGRILRPGKQDKFGHVSVALGKGNSIGVHCLVMLAFKGPRPTGFDIAHSDGDGGNNNLSNLRYATRRENNLDRFKNGKTRLTRDDVLYIRSLPEKLPHGTLTKIAKKLGVTLCTVSSVRAGRGYSHVE